MKTKPTEMNELQVRRIMVRRIMDLWFQFIEKKYGVIERDEYALEAFIEWLEDGQK